MSLHTQAGLRLLWSTFSFRGFESTPEPEADPKGVLLDRSKDEAVGQDDRT